MNKKYLLIAVTLSLLAIPAAVIAQDSRKAPVPIVIDDATCQQRVSVLNYRSRLLENYRKTEQDRYRQMVGESAEQISYAGQWRKADAEKARESLYELNKRYDEFIKSIDQQIKEYEGFEAAQLTCDSSQRSELVDALTKVRGLDESGNVIGGQALIDKNKREFIKYQNGKFTPAVSDLMRNVQKTKKKQPQPKEPKLEIVR